MTYQKFTRQLFAIPKIRALDRSSRKQLARELWQAVEQASAPQYKIWRANHRPPEYVRTALVYDLRNALKKAQLTAGYSKAENTGREGPAVRVARVCFDAAGQKAPKDMRDIFRESRRLIKM